VATINIKRCFPELAARDQRWLVKRHFHAFGQSFIDMGLAWWGSTRRLERLVRFAGREHYDHALASGQGVILLVPHFLGLEVGVMSLSHEGPLCAMFRHVDDPVLRPVMQRRRQRFGLVLVEYNKPLTALVRKVRAGTPLYYLPDQDPRRRASAFVPFFGIPTATFTTLGRLAALTEAIVIPCICRQLVGGAGYELIFKPPLAGFPSGDPLRDAARMNGEIERLVREFPEQYFWVHKRFKTRPPGEPNFYR
jgi:Kdo2-lipid IVA lauroyltransferase/acyltransferase